MRFSLVKKSLALVVMTLLSLSPLQTLMLPLPAQAAVRQLSPSANGVNVGSNANGNVIDISNIISDGAGGFYIAWSDERDGDGSHPYSIYSQRFDSEGNPLSGNGGIKVADIIELSDDGAVDDILVPTLVASDSSKAIVTWRDDQDDTPGNDVGRMFTQAIDSSGNLLYPSLVEQPAELIQDSTSNFFTETPTNPTTISHTINPGSNRYTFVSTTFTRDVDTPSVVIDGMSWDGNFMGSYCGDNNADTDYGGGDFNVVQDIWFLGGASAGTNDLTINWDNLPNDLHVQIDTFRNVDTDDVVYNVDCQSSGVDTADGSPGDIGADSTVSETNEAGDWARQKYMYASFASSARNAAEIFPRYNFDEFWYINIGDLLSTGGTKPSDMNETDEWTQYGWTSDFQEPWGMAAVMVNTIDETVQGAPEATGVPLTVAGEADHFYETLTDGAGGQVNFRIAGSKIYAQRVDARGVPLWGDLGTEVNPNNTNSNAGTNYGFDFDGTNYFAGWSDRDAAETLVAQKINGDGEIQWNAAGSPAGIVIDTTGSYDRRFPLGVVSDGAGGMMMLFSRAPDFTGEIDILVQRLDADGNLLFGAGGIELHSFSSNEDFPFSFGKLERDDDGNFIAVWTRDDGRVYAQKFDTAGDTLWPDSDSAGGVRIGTAQTWANMDVVSDGQGGAFVVMLDTSSNEMVIQGVFENGGLLYSDFYALSEGVASGQPRLFNIAPGEAVVAWEENRDGLGVNAFFMRIENLYQIRDLADLTPLDSGGTDISFETNNGVNDADEAIRIIDDGNDYPLSTIDVNMTQDRAWAGVGGDVDTVNAKSYVTNLTDADGTNGTHTLYVPYEPSHTGVTICPDATSLAEVTLDCSNAVTKTEADSDTSVVTIDSKQVWAITGMTGTGGIGVPSEDEGSSELTFAEGGSIRMLSPKHYTKRIVDPNLDSIKQC